MSLLRAARLSVAAAMLFALTACSAITSTTSGSTTTVAVNLTNAQAQAQATYQALVVEAKTMGPSLTPAQQATLTQSIALLGTAVSTFTAIPATTTVAGTSVATTAQSIVQSAESIVAILPLPPVTQLALQSGLLLINGLIAGIQNIAVPATATTTTTKAAARFGGPMIISGPVSIPLAAPINIPLPNVR